jgi:hypothetical protein
MYRGSVANAIRVLMPVAVSLLVIAAWPASTRAASESAADLVRLNAWMSRLEGKFRVEGTAELPGESGTAELSSIQGRAECRGAHAQPRVPGVECILDMLWEQSSAAQPKPHSAVLLFAFDHSAAGLRHMLVGDDGVAEGGVAQLVNDTLVSTSPCATIKDKCLSKVNITAGPDLQSVKVEISMEVDGKRVGGRQLTLRREVASP